MVNYIMVSLANSLMLLSIMSGKLFIYKRNRQGPCTEPCGTPDITGQVSDSSPSSTTRWVLFERKDPIQVITSLFMPKTMELWQEPFVIYLIKGLAEVHYNNVSLTTFIKCVRDVLYKLN